MPSIIRTDDYLERECPNAMDIPPGTLFSTCRNPTNVWFRTEDGLLSFVNSSGTPLRHIHESEIHKLDAFAECEILQHTSITIRNK